MDLTCKGTIYNLAAGVDYNRISVYIAKGDTTFANLLRDSKVDTSSRSFTVGSPADLRGQRLGGSVGTTNFTCSGLFCGCTGDTDCNKMFSGSACGSIAWSTGDRCYCVVHA